MTWERYKPVAFNTEPGREILIPEGAKQVKTEWFEAGGDPAVQVRMLCPVDRFDEVREYFEDGGDSSE